MNKVVNVSNNNKKQIKIREASIIDIKAITRIYNYTYIFRRKGGEFCVQKCY